MNMDISDAVELAELHQFLHDWTGTDPGRLSESLNEFAGCPAYNLVELRADLNGFTFLLGANDGEALFAPNANKGRTCFDPLISWFPASQAQLIYAADAVTVGG